MSDQKQKWIEFSKLVNNTKKFEPCPVCGGKVMQGHFGGSVQLTCEPECQDCGLRFEAHKRFRLFKGFKILEPSKHFQPAT